MSAERCAGEVVIHLRGRIYAQIWSSSGARGEAGSGRGPYHPGKRSRARDTTGGLGSVGECARGDDGNDPGGDTYIITVYVCGSGSVCFVRTIIGWVFRVNGEWCSG